MARPAKEERNKQLVELRNKNPRLYSYAKLSEIFKISRITAREIYEREKGKKKGTVRAINR
jgi:hypothetical protein